MRAATYGFLRRCLGGVAAAAALAACGRRGADAPAMNQARRVTPAHAGTAPEAPHTTAAVHAARYVLDTAAAPHPDAPPPDTPPRMRNATPPFRYPAALLARRVQGEVTLRLWVDPTGRPRPESTRVAESSGVRALDSAAVAGSARLVFTPARHIGAPIGAPLLFPIHFRHPAASAAARR